MQPINHTLTMLESYPRGNYLDSRDMDWVVTAKRRPKWYHGPMLPGKPLTLPEIRNETLPKNETFPRSVPSPESIGEEPPVQSKAFDELARQIMERLTAVLEQEIPLLLKSIAARHDAAENRTENTRPADNADVDVGDGTEMELQQQPENFKIGKLYFGLLDY